MIKKTFKEILGIDDDDYKIIEMMEKNPDVTHSVIAREIEIREKTLAYKNGGVQRKRSRYEGRDRFCGN